jgi:hypothetical protein
MLTDQPEEDENDSHASASDMEDRDEFRLVPIGGPDEVGHILERGCLLIRRPRWAKRALWTTMRKR